MYLDVEAQGAAVERQSFACAEINSFSYSRSSLQAFAKRCTDIFVSFAALCLLFPFLLAIAVLIRLESRGPSFFTQRRWGRDGRIIRVYKFRSMYVDLCDPTGVNQTVAGDPRITPLGRWLRKTNLDELPQLLNVLLGDMSLVGPRCHAIGMQAGGMLYEDLVPGYHLRHRVRPGMTGLAQVRGWRGATHSAVDAKARIAADLYYIQRMSWFLDVKIMFATILNEVRCASGS